MAVEPAATPDEPLPIRAGVLGIALITFTFAPRIFSMEETFTPAAIERTRVGFNPDKTANTSETLSGLTAIKESKSDNGFSEIETPEIVAAK